MNVNKEKLLKDIKSIEDAIAVMEDQKYELYKSWFKSIERKFNKNGDAFYIKIENVNGSVEYVKVTRMGGGPYKTKYKDTNLSKLVTCRIFFEGLHIWKNDTDLILRSSTSIGINDNFDFITKEKFDEEIENYITNRLVPNAENVRREYFGTDLESLLELFPEYFDRPEVHFFVERFNYIDEHMDCDNPDDFNDWI